MDYSDGESTQPVWLWRSSWYSDQTAQQSVSVNTQRVDTTLCLQSVPLLILILLQTGMWANPMGFIPRHGWPPSSVYPCFKAGRLVYIHLQCVHELMPCLFAYDCSNYCRYLSVYWCETVLLPSTQPDAYAHTQQGECTVQRSHQSPFAEVAVDQALQQTVSRATKVNDGITGFSLHPGDVQCWMLMFTAHLSAMFHNLVNFWLVWGQTHQWSVRACVRRRYLPSRI